MHQAGKKVLTALFAVSTLLALLQPSSRAFAMEDEQKEAAASSLRQGQAKAMTKFCESSLVKLTAVTDFIPERNLASIDSNFAMLYDLRSVTYTLTRKDMAHYATAKLNELPLIASPEADLKVPVVKPLHAEVKAEAVVAENYSLNADLLYQLVNDHRVKLGLAALQKDDNLMNMAKERAPELFDEIFVNGNMHAGFYQRANSYAYYLTENIIYNHSEAGALNWWLGSPIHRAALENPSHTFTGIACSGMTCSMVYTHFQPK